MMVLVALILLTSMFQYIPKSTLAAVIMVSMYYLCEFHVIGVMWRTKSIVFKLLLLLLFTYCCTVFAELDLIPFFATFICSLLLSLEYGMIIGIATNILFILYDSARPKLYFERLLVDQHVVYMVRPKSSLYFPSAEYMRNEILRVCCEEKSTVVLDGKFVRTVDGTHAMVSENV